MEGGVSLDGSTTAVLYGLAALGLALSWRRDRDKTRAALAKARASLLMILSPLVTVILLVALVLTALPPSFLSRLVGAQSGFPGVLLASLAGSVTLIPGFAAFPMAKMLLDNGAGIVQVGVLVSTLMMVGVVTLPMERSIFGWKATLARNALAYGHSFLVGLALWMAFR
ncbi:MAG TPA: permease [Synergistales bacterium]|nr:permease [Synergistales bacterium]